MNKQMIGFITSIIITIVSVFWLWSTTDYLKSGFEPIIVFITGLSGIISSFIWNYFCKKDIIIEKKEYDIFISAPMTSFNSDKYEEIHKLSEGVYDAIINHTNVEKIYSGLLKFKNINDIEDETAAAKNDFQKISSSNKFILIYPEKIVTSCLVEIGYAICLNLPCILFVRDRNDLPYNLKELGQIKNNVLIYIYSDTNSIKNIIRKRGNDIFPSA